MSGTKASLEISLLNSRLASFPTKFVPLKVIHQIEFILIKTSAPLIQIQQIHPCLISLG